MMGMMAVGMQPMQPDSGVTTVSQAKTAGYGQGDITRMERSGQIECETCANRQYQDGSDEMVSFKAPGHISPQAASSAVRSHEQEHVANAYDKASRGGGEVMQASVRIDTSVCPECGRTYVSGGETTTQIKYNSDPYSKGFKIADSAATAGANVDYMAG